MNASWRVLCTLLAFVLATGCNASDSSVELFPSQINLTNEVGSSRAVLVSITNLTEQTKTYELLPSSKRVAPETTSLRLGPEERTTISVYLHCPLEIDSYNDELVVSGRERDTRKAIKITQSCGEPLAEGQGTLDVQIEGLPSKVPAHVLISGPEHTEVFLTESSELSDLPAGHYSLSARPVEYAGQELMFLPGQKEFTLQDSENLSLTVEYGFGPNAGPASLHLRAKSLPADASPSYAIRGPGDFQSASTLPSSFGSLTPGLYVLHVPPVQTEDETGRARHWVAEEHEQEIFLTPGEVRTLRIGFRDSLLVSSATDGAPGSLRDLVESAPADAVIVVPDDLEEISLTQGPIEIKRSLTITSVSSGSTLTTSGNHGAFHIARGTQVHLEGLRLKNAAGEDSPAIRNEGALRLVDVFIGQSRSVVGPSALLSTETLLVDGLHVDQNTSDQGFGAVYIESGEAYLSRFHATDNQATRGAALAVDGKAFVTDAVFAFNKAHEGAAIFNDGTLEITSAAFWLNEGVGNDSFGGAILTESTLRLTNVSFLENSATFGSALAIDGGATYLAHVTFAPNPQATISDIFVSSSAKLAARNTLFSGSEQSQPSLDTIPGATITSLGGNIVPAPGASWPQSLLSPQDRLGAEARLSYGSLVEHDGWARAIALDDTHSGRLAIPGAYCRDARGFTLKQDQLENERPTEFFCDAGAHQSPVMLTGEDFSTSSGSQGSNGSFTTDAAVWSYDKLIGSPDSVQLKPGGYLTANLEAPFCRLSLVVRPTKSSEQPRLTATTYSDDEDEPVNEEEAIVAGQRWRTVSFAVTPATRFRIATGDQGVDIASAHWSNTACPPTF